MLSWKKLKSLSGDRLRDYVKSALPLALDLSGTPTQERLIVLSGPPGCGKGTIWRRLKKDYAGLYAKVLLHTTRPKRERERNGRDYWFVTEVQLRTCEAHRRFLLCPIYDFWHGLDLEAVEGTFEKRRPPLAVLELGRVLAQKLMRRYPNVQSVFVLPFTGSRSELREELICRNVLRNKDFDPRTPDAQNRLHEGIKQYDGRSLYREIIANPRGETGLQQAVDDFVRRTLRPFTR